MQKEKNNRLRVVWICHFSNEQVRKKLNLRHGIDFAPWITLSIAEIEKRDDIELHIVAPYSGLRKDKQYIDNGIHYYFYKKGIPFIRKNWPIFFKYDFWTKYRAYSFKIEKIVRQINPDIINLHGAENPHYSSSILRLLDYSIIVNVQGIYSLMVEGEKKISRFKEYRSTVENEIYKKCKHFGIRAEFMKDYIYSLNSNAKFYWQYYPIKNIFSFDYKDVKKIYDLVFFARIVKAKGIEDLLKAVKILKAEKNDISLVIIGMGSSSYINYLKLKMKSFNIENNVILKGVIQTQQDVHKEVAKAKVSVLPTHHDTIPGTIIESMFLGVPVVSYPTGGIPSLNNNYDCITLAERKNVYDLASKISFILNNKKIANEKAKNSRIVAKERFDSMKQINQLVKFYKEVIAD